MTMIDLAGARRQNRRPMPRVSRLAFIILLAFPAGALPAPDHTTASRGARRLHGRHVGRTRRGAARTHPHDQAGQRRLPLAGHGCRPDPLRRRQVRRLARNSGQPPAVRRGDVPADRSRSEPLGGNRHQRPVPRSCESATAPSRCTGQAEGLTGRYVLSLTEDRAGTIWAATFQGLFQFRGDRWREVGPADGLGRGVGARHVRRSRRPAVGGHAVGRVQKSFRQHPLRTRST